MSSTRRTTATATSWRSSATCSISAIACWSSSRTAISPGRSSASCSISTWQHMLSSSSPKARTPSSSAIAAKAVKEVAYHRELASEWTVRLGDGTEESARRMRDGLDWCWRFVPELFEVDETLEEMIARQTVPDPRSFGKRLSRAPSPPCWPRRSWTVPADQRPILGGRRGHHSEHLGHLLAVMQYPAAHLPRRRLVAPAWPSISTRSGSPKSCRRPTRPMSIRFEIPKELAGGFPLQGRPASDPARRDWRRGSAAQLFLVHRAVRE